MAAAGEVVAAAAADKVVAAVAGEVVAAAAGDVVAAAAGEVVGGDRRSSRRRRWSIAAWRPGCRRWRLPR